MTIILLKGLFVQRVKLKRDRRLGHLYPINRMITLSILSLKDFDCMLYIETWLFTQRIQFFVKTEMTFFSLSKFNEVFFYQKTRQTRSTLKMEGIAYIRALTTICKKSIFQKLQSNPILFAFQIPIVWMLKTCTRRDFKILSQKCNKSIKHKNLIFSQPQVSPQKSLKMTVHLRLKASICSF